MHIITATNKSKAKFEPTIFYMRRKGKAYFRNKWGKVASMDMKSLKYGNQYQFEINELVRNE